MLLIQLIIITFFCFGISSCDESSNDQTNQIRKHQIDSMLKVWEKEDKLSLSKSEQEENQVHNIQMNKLAKDDFFSYYLQNNVAHKNIDCDASLNFIKSYSIDSILSYMDCLKNKKERIKLLRRVLILAKYEHTRKEDSLRFLINAQLMRMISYAYHQDIPSDALESDESEFDSLYQAISSLISENQSKAVILKFINDSIFSYYYMRVEISLPTKNILMLHYNGGGMAGSAEKRYFLKQGNNYKELNLHSIISIVDKKMTKIAKEDASADTDRFEGLFTWNEKKGMHQLELFVHVSSGASCCPPYIVQLYTKDFKNIEPGSLKYATTEHFSDSTIKPVWKDIR